MVDVLSDKNVLVKRALENTSSTTSKQRKLRPQNKFLLCKDHYISPDEKWKENIHGACEKCFKYRIRETLPNGHLPNGHEVLEYLFTLRSRNNGRQINNTRLVTQDLCLHWIYCNVYPASIRSVEYSVEKLAGEYDRIKKWAKKTDQYWQNFDKFCANQQSVLDIIAPTTELRQAQEKAWKLKQCEKDRLFYEAQKEFPRRGYCSSFTDRKWQLSAKRKESRESRSRNERYDDDVLNERSDIGDPIDTYGVSSDSAECSTSNDVQYSPPSGKRSKFDFIPADESVDDPLPKKFRHIRSGLRSVKPEYYKLIEKFISVYHMSYNQAEAAVRETANHLFGREEFGKWKSFDPDQPVDSNTLPQRRNSRENSKLFEAMALNLLVEDVMNSTKTCVVYSHDGSGMNGVGSYVVHSLTIDGVKRTLPVFGVFTETKETLKELQIATYEILSAASDGKYSKEEILSKVNFIMSDSTAHNIGVIEMVCDELSVETVPRTLLCNVHPLMMFDSKLRELCKHIHDGIGGEKLSKCFLVDVDFRRESFPIKAIKCLSNFVCRDFSAKPWNYSTHFGEFIDPKENVTLSLKDSRFNRLSECCSRLLYLIDDIDAYLEKFSDILNNVAIIDRSFVKMEILKPIFAAMTLLGHHITKPFHSLLMSKDTTYTVLLSSFDTLYKELTTLNASQLLTTDQVFRFIPEKLFLESNSTSTLLGALKESIDNYKEEITVLLKIALKLFADGFSHQKGAIFGFGPNAEGDTGAVMKISDASPEELAVLDNFVDVHNIGEERNVGSFNYALTVRGGCRNLESSSRHVVVKSSAEMLKPGQKPSEFRKFRKQAHEIEHIKAQWNDRMRELQERGFSEKELLNVKKEGKRLSDLTFLKSQTIPGPFTSKEEVDNFMGSCPNSNDKTTRMYIEVRYARVTAGIGHNMNFFRLVRKGKKLSCEEYQNGLNKYFESVKQSSEVVSMDDFKVVLSSLEHSYLGSLDDEDDIADPADPSFEIGDHVAVLSTDESLYTWQLGTVDNFSKDFVSVLFFTRKDRKGHKWSFPDDTIAEQVAHEHIICTIPNVRYECSLAITCTLDDQIISQLNHAADELNAN